MMSHLLNAIVSMQAAGDIFLNLGVSAVISHLPNALSSFEPHKSWRCSIQARRLATGDLTRHNIRYSGDLSQSRLAVTSGSGISCDLTGTSADLK